jgi:hypothetical protein
LVFSVLLFSGSDDTTAIVTGFFDSGQPPHKRGAATTPETMVVHVAADCRQSVWVLLLLCLGIGAIPIIRPGDDIVHNV